MKSSEYWRNRFIQLEEASNAYGVKAYHQIESAFSSAEREIQREIQAWFGRYALNNQVNMIEARRQLTTKELKELRWDVDEYISKGRENALNGGWVKELENASAKFHISRLEALKIRVQNAAEVAFGNELDIIDELARRVYTEDYYRSIFEVQKGFNIGWEPAQIDERKLEKIISKPWAADGKAFSQRIWQQRSELVNVLYQELTRTCLLGKGPDDAINAISKRFDVTKKQAGRLVMTEEAYFHSVAQQDAFKELDVEEYEIVATLDSHTSEICQEMDGKVFPMSEYEPGVTAFPFHVWCRSVTVPYFDDNFTERAARRSDGQTYYVPSDMTYKEWAELYVNDANYGLYGKSRDVEQFNRYKAVLKELAPNSLDEFIKIKYNDKEKYSDLKHKYRMVNQYKIDSGNFTGQEIYDLDYKVIHEKRDKFPSDYKRDGNIAGAYIDSEDTLYLAHSRANNATDKCYKNYKGTSNVVLLKHELHYDYIDVLDEKGKIRTDTFYDTEAKLFEEFHEMLKTRDFNRITMLSERGMCKSCKNVMEQFKREHPNVEVRVISNKKEFGDVWGERLATEARKAERKAINEANKAKNKERLKENGQN